MTEGLRSTAPVTATGGFGERTPPQPQPRSRAGDHGTGSPSRALDRVSVDADAAGAMRLLRERVLARTRAALGVPDGAGGPGFAEIVDGEAVPVFLGRLLSAQNQIAARRSGDWTPEAVRRACHRALEHGVAETLELLAADGRSHHPGIGVVGEVLVEYGRRLAALAGVGAWPPAG